MIVNCILSNTALYDIVRFAALIEKSHLLNDLDSWVKTYLLFSIISNLRVLATKLKIYYFENYRKKSDRGHGRFVTFSN